MTGSNDTLDPRPFLRRALGQTAAIVAGVRRDQLELPTPCRAFDVRALLGHIVFAARRIGAIGRGETLATDAPAVVGVDDSGWVAALEEAGPRAVAAWDRPGALQGDIALPFGTFPATVVVWMYTLEQLVHGWDLAAATSSGVALDASLAEAALPAAQGMIVPEFRGDEPMPFAQVVAVPGDAPVYDRLAGFMGRDPAWAAVESVGGAA